MEAKKIFVYGDSYATRTLLFHVEHLLNFTVSDIFILSENHRKSEFVPISNDINLHVCSNINECLLNVDAIIVLNDSNIPEDKFKRIIEFSKVENKKCIIVDNPWNTLQVSNIGENNDRSNDCPFILNISIGRYSEQYCTELMINRVLANKNISFFQEYSPETNHLIKCLEKHGVVSDSMVMSKDNQSKAKVIVKSIHAEDLFDSRIEKSFFEKNLPDYLVLSCMKDCDSLNELEKLFWYKYNIKIDLVVVAPYILFEKFDKEYVAIYSKVEEINSNFCTTNEDMRLEKNVEESIFSKLGKVNDITVIG